MLHAVLLVVFPIVLGLGPSSSGWERGHCPASGGMTGSVATYLIDSLPANDEPCLEAVVLGMTSSPFKALVALKNGPDKYTLRVVGEKGKVLGQEVLAFDEKSKAPEFESSALKRLEKAVELTSSHKLSRAEAGDIPSHGLGIVTLQKKKRISVMLVTSAGESAMLTLRRKAKWELKAYFDRKGKGVLLVGWVDKEGTGDPAKRIGILEVKALPGKLKKLTDKRVSSLLVSEAELLVDLASYDKATSKLQLAFSRHTSPQGLFLATVAYAYGQQWKTSCKYGRKLRDFGTNKATELHEKLPEFPLVREARLRRLGINGSKKFKFKASKGFEGTSVWVKIKDADGKNIAIFKPTNGNTYDRGEVFTYQMAKILGIEQMYPVTILHTLDKTGCKKFSDALDKVAYKGMKERNRKKLMKKCRKGRLEGAVKEWVLDFQFFQAIGKTERLKKHSLYKHLTYKGTRPTAGKYVEAKTVTRLYKPDRCKRATYRGKLDRAQLARDLSDLMILDVLNANEDRFPGANIDFKSLGKAKETKECVFDFGESRLFSLDNGATFKGTYSNAFVDFTKRLKVSRFRKETFRRLVDIDRFVKGKRSAPDCLATWGIKKVKDLSRFVALDKGDSHKRRKEPFKLFTSNLRAVLKHMRKYKKNKNAWFK